MAITFCQDISSSYYFLFCFETSLCKLSTGTTHTLSIGFVKTLSQLLPANIVESPMLTNLTPVYLMFRLNNVKTFVINMIL